MTDPGVNLNACTDAVGGVRTESKTTEAGSGTGAEDKQSGLDGQSSVTSSVFFQLLTCRVILVRWGRSAIGPQASPIVLGLGESPDNF